MIGSFMNLNNGVRMPAFGLGVFQSKKDEAVSAVRFAIKSGYRLIDTASAYGNEAEVGSAIAQGDIPREDIFVTTKVKPDDFGTYSTEKAFDTSMAALGFDVLDLYLLHWPVPKAFDKTVESWKVCERLLAEGRVRAIGVCNFSPAHLKALAERTEITPAVNQIESHPYFTRADHDAAHAGMGIVTQAWSPIGGVLRYWGDGETKRDPLHDATIGAIAETHSKSAAQIMLRWHIQLGHSVVPKSVNPKRIEENAAIYDFILSPDEMTVISDLNRDLRGGPDPDTRS